MSGECPLRIFLSKHTTDKNPNLTSMSGGKYYIKPEELNTFYEVLAARKYDYCLQEPANRDNCKLFLDIDKSVTDQGDWITDKFMDNVCCALTSEIKGRYNTKAEISIIPNNKFPRQKLHLYVLNVAMPKKERVNLYEVLIARVPELKGRLDVKVNGLRLIYNYKPTKKVKSVTGWDIGGDIPDLEGGCYEVPGGDNIESFRKYSIISGVNTELTQLYRNIIYGLAKDPWDDRNIDSDGETDTKVVDQTNIELVYALVKEHIHVKGNFTLNEGWINNSIILKRIKPSVCNICNRQHDNIGGYVTFNNDSYFIGCYRADKGKYIKVQYKDKPKLKFDITPHLIAPQQELTTGDNKIVIPKPGVQWVQPFTEERCRVIKAPLGKGKTKACMEWINSLPSYQSILVLTPRRSFAKSITNELNSYKRQFACYLDESNVKGKLSLVIQFESLHKLSDIKEHFTHIILDECESILTQTTSIETQADYYRKNHTTFVSIINECSSLTLMDAFISNKTIDFLNSLKVPYTYYDYSSLGYVPRTYIWYSQSDKGDLELFTKSLIDDLKEGKKIFMFCSSNNQLNKFVQKVSTEQPETLIKEYHKGKDIDSNVRDIWGRYDLVITTSSITVGVNYDIPGVFDRLYIYVNAASRNLVRDIFQSSMRVRHLTENKLILYTDKRPIGLNLPTIKNAVIHDLEAKDGLIKKEYDRMYQDTIPTYRELYVNNTLEHNQSIMCLDDLIDLYLKHLNYTLSPMEYDSYEEVDDMLKDVSNSEGNEDYNEIKSITYDEFKVLKGKGPKRTDEESVLMEKFIFQTTILLNTIIKTEGLEGELWGKYITGNNKSKFHNLKYEKGIYESTCTKDEISERCRRDIFDKLTLIKLRVIEDLCKQLNIPNSQSHNKVLRSDIEKMPPELINDLITAFNYRDNRVNKDSWEVYSLLGLINHALHSWGFSYLMMDDKRIRKMIAGERFELTNFHIDGDDILQYIHPKQYGKLKLKKLKHARPKLLPPATS
jgi:Origin of replication binding protein